MRQEVVNCGRRSGCPNVDWIVGCHSRTPSSLSSLDSMAGTTGLEPATSAVTGQRSDQLSYVPSAISSDQQNFEALSKNCRNALISRCPSFRRLRWNTFEFRPEPTGKTGSPPPDSLPLSSHEDHEAVTTPLYRIVANKFRTLSKQESQLHFGRCIRPFHLWAPR